MYATLRDPQITYSWLFHWCGRLGGVIVMASWLALVVVEWVQSGLPESNTWPQAAALFVIFAGYLYGWKNELSGGALAVAGTVLLFAVHAISFGYLPLAPLAMLAVPGICFLLAWCFREAFSRVEK